MPTAGRRFLSEQLELRSVMKRPVAQLQGAARGSGVVGREGAELDLKTEG